MKITKVDVYLLDGGAQRHERKPVVCRVHTDEGVYGDGEAGIAYGIGATGAFGMVKDLAAMLIGRDPMDVESIWSTQYKKSFWGLGGGPIFFAGMSALNIALMDIKGKVLNVPCYQLLGGKYRSEMRAYASQLQEGWNEHLGPFGTEEEYVKITQLAMEDGYDAVKLDFTMYDKNGVRFPKEQWEGILSNGMLDLIESRMRAIREACGWDLDIIVENHCRTQLPSAIQIGELCDKYRIFSYEEPTGTLNPELHREIRKYIKTPLASGERIYTRWGYYNFLKDYSVQLIQPDVCNCGGMTEIKKICDLAEIYDATVQVHVAGGPISTAAALQVEAAIPNFCIHEHHFRSTQPAMAVLGKYDYQPVNGKFQLPELPGIGQEISDWAIENALLHEEVRGFVAGSV